MTTEINVISRTQIINVEPVSGTVSVINAGPAGPGGASGTAVGTGLLVGTAPPTPGDGAVGNFFVDKTNKVLYGPKAASGTIWPVLLYGFVSPPVLLGENRVTSNPPYSSNMLSVPITLTEITRLRVEAHLIVNSNPAGGVFAFECALDGSIVGRFAYPITAQNDFINGPVIIPAVAVGAHTLSVKPSLKSGSVGSPTFLANATLPAYLSVYKDIV